MRTFRQFIESLDDEGKVVSVPSDVMRKLRDDDPPKPYTMDDMDTELRHLAHHFPWIVKKYDPYGDMGQRFNYEPGTDTLIVGVSISPTTIIQDDPLDPEHPGKGQELHIPYQFVQKIAKRYYTAMQVGMVKHLHPGGTSYHYGLNNKDLIPRIVDYSYGYYDAELHIPDARKMPQEKLEKIVDNFISTGKKIDKYMDDWAEKAYQKVNSEKPQIHTGNVSELTRNLQDAVWNKHYARAELLVKLLSPWVNKEKKNSRFNWVYDDPPYEYRNAVNVLRAAQNMLRQKRNSDKEAEYNQSPQAQQAAIQRAKQIAAQTGMGFVKFDKRNKKWVTLVASQVNDNDPPDFIVDKSGSVKKWEGWG